MVNIHNLLKSQETFEEVSVKYIRLENRLAEATYLMYFLTCLTCLLIGTSLAALCSGDQTKLWNPISLTPTSTNAQQNNLPYRRAGVTVKVKLRPYEILASKATSYADISLTVSNNSEKVVETEVMQINILASGSQQVLMSLTPQELDRPSKVSLQSGESRVLQHRLQSESKLYRRGQDVIAQIHYRQGSQTESVVQSEPEAVAFTIP